MGSKTFVRTTLVGVGFILIIAAITQAGVGSTVASRRMLAPLPGAPAPAVTTVRPTYSPTGGALPDEQGTPGVIIERIACPGDPAPGIPGFTLGSVVAPRIDGAGNVIFFDYLTGPFVQAGNARAVFYGQPGDLHKLLWESDPAPDMPPGVVISDLSYNGAMFSEDGLVAVTANLSGPGIIEGFNDRVFYVGQPGDLHKVLQGGDQAPGCEPGVYIDVEATLGFGGLLSDHGTLLVAAYLAGPGVEWDSDRAFWTGTPENLQLVYRDGMQAPGCDEGVRFVGCSSIVHNDAGEVAISANVLGPGVDTTNNSGHWVGGPGALVKVAREGEQVPGMPSGVTFFAVPNAGRAINTWREFPQPGYLQGPGISEANDRFLFLGDADGMLHQIAREGDPAPEAGPGVYYRTFSNCMINDRGETLCCVSYSGAGITDANKWAVYFGSDVAWGLALRDGDPAPTFAADVTLWAVSATIAYAAMNDVGDIVAPARIAGPGITEDNDKVLWMWRHETGGWIPLLRSGDNVDGHIIYAADESDLFYSDKTGGGDGQFQSFNDLGMLAINLQFTDGTEGIYRITPPPVSQDDGHGGYTAAVSTK